MCLPAQCRVSTALRWQCNTVKYTTQRGLLPRAVRRVQCVDWHTACPSASQHPHSTGCLHSTLLWHLYSNSSPAAFQCVCSCFGKCAGCTCLRRFACLAVTSSQCVLRACVHHGFWGGVFSSVSSQRSSGCRVCTGWVCGGMSTSGEVEAGQASAVWLALARHVVQQCVCRCFAAPTARCRWGLPSMTSWQCCIRCRATTLCHIQVCMVGSQVAAVRTCSHKHDSRNLAVVLTAADACPCAELHRL